MVVILGWEWPWNGGGWIARSWLSLGNEMGEISEAFGALVCSGLKERKNVVFLAEKGGELGSLRLGIALRMHIGEGSVFWCLGFLVSTGFFLVFICRSSGN